MSCEIIIRRAQNVQLKQRMELVRSGFSAYFWDAFVYFFFQELTLECCVLAAAVLFIFCGVGAGGVVLVVPGAAVAVALLVCAAHSALAHKHAQSLRGEIYGFVAEVQGSLSLSPGLSPVSIIFNLNERENASYSHVVGTVSVSEFWGPQNHGWLHAMAVHPQWRGRGVGRALAGVARAEASARGLAALETAVGALQAGARAALSAAGWECRGAYARLLAGAALTLPMLRLRADLPLA